MLTRFSDWQTRLHCFVMAHQYARFEYGLLDCCIFTCDAVLAMTGTDLAASFRGKYESRDEAVARIHEYTGKKTVRSVAVRVAKEHGMKEVKPAFAQRGDVVLVRRSKDYSLGFIGLNGQDVLALAESGILRLPLAEAVLAWRV